ncbi:MAG: prepilin-type N-terminal cleavage/methylation domain-containing protein, partial [Elusimicrobiaceae bacterium]|nr:prepilin-type N-terminal cleavage/methylation domain-containing protein [Elusimicrobiaceae bacterium]
MKITRSKKKAFTLTELLVVVVLAGVLAVTVLPKFNKMLESRKTTEAEDVMRAIRTEQELRCSLDKPYASSFSALSDLVASNDSTHYKYSLTSSGISAINKGTRDYFLSMPSYEDGRVCCSGSYCSSLNKDYPLCEDLVSRSDYKSGAACAVEEPSIPDPDPLGCTGESRRVCGCQGRGVQERECDSTTGTWGDWSSCSIDDCQECTGDAKRLCGCNNEGFQLRECDPLTGTWSAWGACSIEDCVSCTGESRRACGCKGKGTQKRECNTATGEWGEWLDCPVGECQECEGESERLCDCHGNEVPGPAVPYKVGTQTRECDELTGTWGEWSACSVSPCLSCEGSNTRLCDCHGNEVPGPAVPYK